MNKEPSFVVAFSPDGTMLASDSKYDVVLGNAGDGSVVQVMKGQKDSIHVLAFNSDGSAVACITLSGVVKIWSTEDGTLL